MWDQLDLHPPWPSPASLTPQLNDKTLTPGQRAELVQHAVSRACLFADLPLLTFCLHDPLCKDLVDLHVQDEDGLGMVSQSILGFGDGGDRDLDREECIRLLISQGASVDTPDYAGWTPLHHAALRAPPSFVVYLLTHGASPLTMTLKSLTPLDVINGYQPVPDRQDVALILEEAMREQGWQGTPLELRRQTRNRQRQIRATEKAKRVAEWEKLGRILGMGEKWWAAVCQEEDDADDGPLDRDEDLAADEAAPEEAFTPLPDYTTMLVFSPTSIPSILQSIILNASPALYPVSRRSAPANAVYHLARFACIHCDESWFDALLTGVVDRIEEVVYTRPNRSEDMVHLAFWLYNSTLLLHLLKCDRDLYEMCESLDLFSLMEELINAIYVFVLRGVEKRLDPLIDPALLDHSPLGFEFDSIQFEGDWSFFRSLTGSRRKTPTSASQTPLPYPIPPSSSHPALAYNTFEPPPKDLPSPSTSSYNKSISTSSLLAPQSPSASSFPSSTAPSYVPSSAASMKSGPFSTLRQTIGRSNPPNPISTSSNGHYPAIPTPTNTGPSPTSITAILTSIHTLLTLYTINPIIIVQLHSQVMYWVSCEVFNRILTRKKLLCRSRAMQISLNLSVLEEWTGSVGLPSGVGTHFVNAKELLTWLQCHSSINQFLSLVDTIQTMRSLNPLQMRRAVREYRYEVGEDKMSEECTQYLAQLQKDWERRRVKMGVAALRKEIGNGRERAGSESITSGGRTPPDTDTASLLSLPSDAYPSGRSSHSHSPTSLHAPHQFQSETQLAVDALFDRDRLKNEWMPPKPPDVLGELLDSTYMLPLVLPSDPEMLAAWPATSSVAEILAHEEEQRIERRQSATKLGMDVALDLGVEVRSPSRASVGNRGAMLWRGRVESVRRVEPEMVDWVDGGVRVRTDVGPASAYGDEDEDEEAVSPGGEGEDDVGVGRLDRLGEEYEEDELIQTTPVDSFTSNPQFLMPSGGSGSLVKSTPSQRRRSRRVGRESSGGDTIVPENYSRASTMTPERVGVAV